MSSEQMSSGRKPLSHKLKKEQIVDSTADFSLKTHVNSETIMHSNPLMAQRQTRRLSVREAILEENLAQLNSSIQKDQNESTKKVILLNVQRKCSLTQLKHL